MLQEGEGGKKWEGQMDGQAKRQKRKDGREGKGERRGGAVQWDGKLVRGTNDWTKEERKTLVRKPDLLTICTIFLRVTCSPADCA